MGHVERLSAAGCRAACAGCLCDAATRSTPLQVLASVFGPHEVTKRGERLDDRAIVKCEYSMAAFSTGVKGLCWSK